MERHSSEGIYTDKSCLSSLTFTLTYISQTSDKLWDCNSQTKRCLLFHRRRDKEGNFQIINRLFCVHILFQDLLIISPFKHRAINYFITSFNWPNNSRYSINKLLICFTIFDAA